MSYKPGKLSNRRYRTLTKMLEGGQCQFFRLVDWVKLLKTLSKEDALWRYSKAFELCPFDKWTAAEWGLALQGMPELIEKCPPEMCESISGEDWVNILKLHLKLHSALSDCCDWDRVAGADWLSLLREQPSLVTKHNWDYILYNFIDSDTNSDAN